MNAYLTDLLEDIVILAAVVVLLAFHKLRNLFTHPFKS